MPNDVRRAALIFGLTEIARRQPGFFLFDDLMYEDGFIIRPARRDDAETLAKIGRETFIETFGHLYSKQNLAAFLDKNHTPAVYRAMAGEPDVGMWLAQSGAEEAAGYAVACPCSLPVPDLPPNSGELARLYLAAGVQGTGLGARLLETALEFLRMRFERIFLSVYSENLKAQRFYKRYGFVKIHDYFYMVGDHADPEWIMELKSNR